tara:strand:- start:873 stop:2258 length:1386 start_codon:yes stop_codon:yes gene_type:complete
LRKKKDFSINQHQILNFLWFNKCFGQSTYDNFTKFLIPASILKINYNNVKLVHYWEPIFKKNNLSIKKAGEKFIQLLVQSASRLTSDKKKYGVFLSGGHDSRLVISSFKNQIESFTVSYQKNFESKCAKDISNSLGFKNTFIKLEKNHFEKNFKDIIRICGAQYTFIDALFINLDKKYFNEIDYVFHGHGLDYLFQGMYLPAKYYKIFGSPIFFKKIQFEYNNVYDEFINNISFRNKDFDLRKVIKKNYLESFNKNLKSEIKSLVMDEKFSSFTKYDIWEYLIIHSLGRHYSRANIISKLTNVKERTLIFDNDLFSFYLSLNIKQRINSDIVRYAISNINDKIGKIPTGNWGFPAKDGPLIKTMKLILRKLLRIISGNQKFKAPTAEDRTWPDRETYLQKNSFLRNEIELLFKDKEFILLLDKLDWKLLNNYKIDWMNNKKGGAKLLMSLISIYKFIKLTE